MAGDLPQPSGTFAEWAAQTASLLGVSTEVPDPTTVPWQRWAVALVEVPALQAESLPAPGPFETWEAWVAGLKLAYSGP